MNEEIKQTTPFGGNAVTIQKDRTAFVIFDNDTKQYYMEKGLDFPPGILVADPFLTVDNFDTELKKVLDQGNENVFVVDSIKELASKTGINQANLIKTVDKNNKA